MQLHTDNVHSSTQEAIQSPRVQRNVTFAWNPRSNTTTVSRFLLCSQLAHATRGGINRVLIYACEVNLQYIYIHQQSSYLEQIGGKVSDHVVAKNCVCTTWVVMIFTEDTTRYCLISCLCNSMLTYFVQALSREGDYFQGIISRIAGGYYLGEGNYTHGTFEIGGFLKSKMQVVEPSCVSRMCFLPQKLEPARGSVFRDIKLSKDVSRRWDVGAVVDTTHLLANQSTTQCILYYKERFNGNKRGVHQKDFWDAPGIYKNLHKALQVSGKTTVPG